jgi:2-amino-4-hydroxy-6-hydroxymethyldihydropteridine diphosphokinase
MILVAVGANLPRPDGARPLETCLAAVGELAKLPGSRLISVSRWYETEPVPRSDQPNYINGVARLERVPGAGPKSLLAAIQEIETRFGRRRAEQNAARTLDLDLIDMDGVVLDTPDLILPHPRAHLRAFVLLPLLDVAPDWVHPTNGRSGLELSRTVDRTGMRILNA